MSHSGAQARATGQGGRNIQATGNHPPSPMTKHHSHELQVQEPACNAQQQAFVAHYLLCGNATAAAIKAGYSPKSASSLGYQLLQNARVRSLLRGRQRQRERIADVSAAAVLRQAQRMAFADPRAFVDENGDPIPLQDLSDEAAAAVQVVDLSGIRPVYKMVDKGAAVDRLMRHLGLFKDDNTQAVDAVGQLLAAIHSRGSRLPLA